MTQFTALRPTSAQPFEDEEEVGPSFPPSTQPRGSQSNESADEYGDQDYINYVNRPEVVDAYNRAVQSNSAAAGSSHSVPPSDSSWNPPVDSNARTSYSLPPSDTAPSTPSKKRRLKPTDGAHSSMVNTAIRRESEVESDHPEAQPNFPQQQLPAQPNLLPQQLAAIPPNLLLQHIFGNNPTMFGDDAALSQQLQLKLQANILSLCGPQGVAPQVLHDPAPQADEPASHFASPTPPDDQPASRETTPLARDADSASSPPEDVTESPLRQTTPTPTPQRNSPQPAKETSDPDELEGHHGTMDSGEDGAGANEQAGQHDSTLTSATSRGISPLTPFEDGPRQPGRPTNEQLTLLYKGFKEMYNVIRGISEATGIAPLVVMERFNKHFSLGRHDTFWNVYEKYAASEEHKLEEARRLLKTKQAAKYKEFEEKSDKKFTADLLSITFKLFKAEHGEEKYKELLTDWAQVNNLEAVGAQQSKGERKRTFESITRQLDNFLDMCSILYEFQFWVVGAGGQILSDQSLVHVYENERNAGFAETGFLRTRDGLCGSYRAHLGKLTIDHVTKQEVIALAEAHGLVVTEARPSSSSTNTAGTAQPSQTTSVAPRDPNKNDVCDKAWEAVSNLALNINVDFRKKLHWRSLVAQCVDRGFCIVNYPLNVTIPWESKGAAMKKGVKGLTHAEHLAILEGCAPSAQHPFHFKTVESIRLRTGDVPILSRAPDSEGNVEKIFFDKVRHLVSGGGTQKPRKVKVECQDHDSLNDSDSAGGSTPTPSQSYPPRRSARSAPSVSFDLESAQDDDNTDQLAQDDVDEDMYGLDDAINAADNDMYSDASPSKLKRKKKSISQTKGKGKASVSLPVADTIDTTPKAAKNKRKDSPSKEEVTGEASAKRVKATPSVNISEQGWGSGFTSYGDINRLRGQQAGSSSISSIITATDADFQPMTFHQPIVPAATSKATAPAPAAAASVKAEPQSMVQRQRPVPVGTSNAANVAAPVAPTVPQANPLVRPPPIRQSSTVTASAAAPVRTHRGNTAGPTSASSSSIPKPRPGPSKSTMTSSNAQQAPKSNAGVVLPSAPALNTAAPSLQSNIAYGHPLPNPPPMSALPQPAHNVQPAAAPMVPQTGQAEQIPLEMLQTLQRLPPQYLQAILTAALTSGVPPSGSGAGGA
ncbi:hypothetical protein AAF712_011236 [Marasmius tenuissimus]|uniref:Uncharacterized protein n=1 Tax=Marasmius tenuissimus TaxID=585030 RepID=A0ABR2ZJX5_9AGAR